ncbi:hypothetical protein [Rubellimicrobium roseum]|uniref:DUF4175 domain-containing protein n=1 Tax=Rubellimicrobium roseum TaxID=687525 RepID=A0A5C4N762_9RHOB|nr:hypothetical protein [Rubellimicrobium roseum]TNC67566.1 hypothetical protein FHG71_15315 [Rubellimicrobium roseum]
MSWFRPKAYGYGATPSHWKGWVAVAAFLAVEAALAWALLGGSEDPVPGRLLAFLAVSAGLVAIFVRVSKVRTDGDWRWRWGGRNRHG